MAKSCCCLLQTEEGSSIKQVTRPDLLSRTIAFSLMGKNENNIVTRVCFFSILCTYCKRGFLQFAAECFFFVTRAADVGVEILIGGQGSATDRS